MRTCTVGKNNPVTTVLDSLTCSKATGQNNFTYYLLTLSLPNFHKKCCFNQFFSTAMTLPVPNSQSTEKAIYF